MAKPDLFTKLRPDKDLHPQFKNLRDSPMFEPARGVLRELYTDYSDPDGNFVEQFQTNGFNARTFEIYLFALFRASRFAVSRQFPSPDYLLQKDGHVVCVEATTANPSGDGPKKPYSNFSEDALTPDEMKAYLRNQVPIRMGSPLFTKLGNEYWKLPHVAGNPLVFAIQSFHDTGSLGISSTPLAEYLFGLGHRWYHNSDGKLIITADAIDAHKVGAKEIPSGFFAQPSAENVSAVLFSNSGTVPKFNRMGHEGTHRSEAVRMIRYGTCYRHDPNSDIPAPFLYEVGDGEDRERWDEGTVLMHNPRARHPIPSGLMDIPIEERLVNGQIVTTFTMESHGFLPYSSLTINFPGDTTTSTLQIVAEKISAHLQALYPIEKGEAR